MSPSPSSSSNAYSSRPAWVKNKYAGDEEPPSAASSSASTSFRTSTSPLMRNDPSTSSSSDAANKTSTIPYTSAPYLPPPAASPNTTYSASPSAIGLTARAADAPKRSSPTITFPSAFGVSQRVAIKSTRPSPAGHQSTSSASTNGRTSRNLDGNRSSTPSSLTDHSQSHHRSSDPVEQRPLPERKQSLGTVQAWLNTRQSTFSTASTASTSSIIHAPAPLASTAESPRQQIDSSPMSDQISVFTAPTHLSSSIIDRTKPKTPEVFQDSAFGAFRGSQPFPGKPPSATEFNVKTRNEAVKADSQLAGLGMDGVGIDTTRGSGSGRRSASEGVVNGGSIMDRPRPTTPDSNAYLSSKSPSSSAAADMRTARYAYEFPQTSRSLHSSTISTSSSVVKPSTSTPNLDDDWAAPLSAPVASITPIAASFLPNRLAAESPKPITRNHRSASTSTTGSLGHLRHKSSTSTGSIASFATSASKKLVSRMPFSSPSKSSLRSFDRSGLEDDYNSSPGRSSLSSHRYSEESDRPRYISKGVAPTLSLDLDLGGSETMFDLAGLLGGGASAVTSMASGSGSGQGRTNTLLFGSNGLVASRNEDDSGARTPRAVQDDEPPTPRANQSQPSSSFSWSAAAATPTSAAVSTVRPSSPPKREREPRAVSPELIVSSQPAVPSSVERSPLVTTSSNELSTLARAFRKEPPRVDTRLEKEFEVEKAIDGPKEASYANEEGVGALLGSRMIGLGSAAPIVTSLPSNSFAPIDPPSIEPVNFDSSEPSPIAAVRPNQPKRRRSFASLLTRSPSRKDDLQSSTSPEPSLSMSNSTSFSQLSTASANSTNATTVGQKDTSFDKSLPPTPASSSPELAVSPKLSPVLDTAPSAPKANAFSKGFTKLRNAGGRQASNSVFQVISATTTKKLSSASNTSAIANGSTSGTQSSTPPAQGSPSSIGKRVAGVLSGKSNSPTKKESEFADSTLSADSSRLAPKTGLVRRGSLSGLLNGNGGGEGKKATLLGMSLPAGRKSEELLGRFGGKKKEPKGTFVTPEMTRGASHQGDAGRRSFDLLTKPTTNENEARSSFDDTPAYIPSQSIKQDPSADVQGSISNASLTSLQASTASDISSASDLGQVEKAHIVHSIPAPIRVPPPLLTTTSNGTTPSSLGPPRTALSSGPRSASPASSSYRSAPRTPITDNGDLTLTDNGSNQQRVSSPAPPISSSTPAGLVLGNVVKSSRTRSPAPSTPQLSPGGSTSEPVVAAPPVEALPTWRKRGQIPARAGFEDRISRIWLDLEDSLASYKIAVRENRPDRGPLVSNSLLAFLRREEDEPSPRATPELANRQRQILFDWLDVLTAELREMQPSHRGICLEAVAAILECHLTSAAELHEDEIAQTQYRSAVVKVLVFAIEKLNDKAVYANTLVFSGRILALTFFRIEGVALKLLRALPPIKKAYLKRILEEVGIMENRLPPVDLDVFPSHLWSLCLSNMKAYTGLLLPIVPKATTDEDKYLVKDGATVVEMSGNWLIRWTASDSDLPFAFYRAYHRQLAAHLVPFEQRDEFRSGRPINPSAVITAPGCLFLAASILEKTDALVHRNLRSVTSIGPNNSNFNTNDSANLSFGQKPKILELANRRVIATMLDIVGGPPSSPNEEAPTTATSDAYTRRRVFGRMLQLWIRACVKKTSMWDTRSVFILLDLLEGMIYTLSYPAPSANRSSEDDIIVPRPSEACLEMFDIPFMFSFVKLILEKADNTVTLMRTIAFLYAHFEIFTLRPSDRKQLCESIILDKDLFPRLYLHWNAGVRGYFIRLLVWRLARLGVVDAEQNPDKPRDPAILELFGLMNVRLEAIRKRHDELEPLDNLTDDDFFQPKRSTICSTRGVKEAPFAVDELVGSLAENSDEDGYSEDDVDQEMVNSSPILAPDEFVAISGGNGSTASPSASSKKAVPSVSRVVSWLKGGLSKKQSSVAAVSNAKSSSISSMEELNAPNSRGNPFIVDSIAAKRQAAEAALEGSPSLGSPSETISSSPSSSSRQDSSWTSLPPSNPSDADLDSHDTVVEQQDSVLMRPPRPSSPAFFAFEFEGAAVASGSSGTENSSGSGSSPASPTSPTSSATSMHSTSSADTVFPHTLRRQAIDPNNPHNPLVSQRVSLRFSKRISILPPAALDLFKETGAPVPAIPERFKPQVYDRKLHQYAVRSLREYEDALDEWTDWVARLQEEEDEGKKFNKGFVDAVPRLAVSWPSSFESEEG